MGDEGLIDRDGIGQVGLDEGRLGRLGGAMALVKIVEPRDLVAGKERVTFRGTRIT